MKNNKKTTAAKPFYKRISFWVILAVIIIKMLKISDDLTAFEEYLPAQKLQKIPIVGDMHNDRTKKGSNVCEAENSDTSLSDRKDDTKYINPPTAKSDTRRTKNPTLSEPIIDDYTPPNNIEKENKKSVFKFVLNNSTKKYHTKNCAAERRLTGDKRQETEITAASESEAISVLEERGYKRCGLCK